MDPSTFHRSITNSSNRNKKSSFLKSSKKSSSLAWLLGLIMFRSLCLHDEISMSEISSNSYHVITTLRSLRVYRIKFCLNQKVELYFFIQLYLLICTILWSLIYEGCMKSLLSIVFHKKCAVKFFSFHSLLYHLNYRIYEFRL